MNQSLKADAGKPRWGLLPWRAIALLADVVTFGASKYGDASWRRVEASRYEDALHRHLHAWRMGERNDRESGIHHLAHALCNIAFMLELSLDKDDADDLRAKLGEQLRAKRAELPDAERERVVRKMEADGWPQDYGGGG